MKTILLLSCLLVSEFKAGNDANPHIATKEKQKQRLLGEQKQLHLNRIQERSRRIDEIINQKLQELNVDTDSLSEHKLNFDQFSQEMTDEYVEHLQYKLITRSIDSNLHLFANEKIFGSDSESIFIHTIGWHTKLLREAEQRGQLEAAHRVLKELARTVYQTETCPPIIEVNLKNDFKLQKIINLFGVILENIEKLSYPDPYWQLALLVQSLFSENKEETSMLKKLNDKKDREILIGTDDKTFSGTSATKLGDMMGSEHKCAQRSILFKIISDYYHMPCRLVANTGHAFNMVPSTNNGDWKIVDIAQYNYNNMYLGVSAGIAKPIMPINPKDVYDYTTFISNVAFVTGTLKGEIPENNQWRMILADTENITDNDEFSMKISNDLLQYMVLMLNEPVLTATFLQIIKPIMDEIIGLEASIKSASEEDRNEYKRKYLEKNMELRCTLSCFMQRLLESDKRSMVLNWIKQDAQRKEYFRKFLQSEDEVEEPRTETSCTSGCIIA